LPALPEYALSPVTITVVNTKTKSKEFAYIYITKDRAKDEAWGHLDVTIGASEPFAVLDTSSLQITFPPDLLSRNDLEQVRLEANDEALWSLALTGDNELTVRLMPGQQVPVTSDKPARFGLQNVLAFEGQTLHRRVTFEWTGFKDVKDNSRDFIIERAYIPEIDRGARLSSSWVPRTEYDDQFETVYPSTSAVKIANRVVLRIVSAEPLVSAGAEFTVSFWTETLGDARRAVCTAEQLKDVICSPYESSDPAWTARPVTEGSTRYWILKPPPIGEFFPKDNMVSFEFVNLVTQMPRGSSPVLVQWSGIKDRSPGYEVKPLTKTEEPKPQIVSFAASVDGRPVGHMDKVHYRDKVVLTWKVFAADSCTFADSITRYPTESTREVIADSEVNTYTLTPRISLEQSEKYGTSRTIQLGLLPAVAAIEAERASIVPCDVKLSWSTRGGDAYISGPDLPRTLMPPSGAIQVKADRNITYRVECIGLTTASDFCNIRVPSPIFNPTLEWFDGGKKGRFSWTTEHSLVTWGYASVAHPPGPSFGGSEGSLEFDKGEILAFPADSFGNYKRVSFSYILSPSGKVFPPFSFQEEEDPKGPNRVVSWDMEGYAVTAIGRFPGTLDGRDAWLSPAKKGSYRLPTTDKWKFYVVMAAIDSTEQGGVILLITPYHSFLLSSEADLEEPTDRLKSNSLASLDLSAPDLASFITRFLASASQPDATGDSVAASLLELYSPTERSSS
jgi:hypothetical protein